MCGTGNDFCTSASVFSLASLFLCYFIFRQCYVILAADSTFQFNIHCGVFHTGILQYRGVRFLGSSAPYRRLLLQNVALPVSYAWRGWHKKYRSLSESLAENFISGVKSHNTSFGIIPVCRLIAVFSKSETLVTKKKKIRNYVLLYNVYTMFCGNRSLSSI